jgi:hypothetical protein
VIILKDCLRSGQSLRASVAGQGSRRAASAARDAKRSLPVVIVLLRVSASEPARTPARRSTEVYEARWPENLCSPEKGNLLTNATT